MEEIDILGKTGVLKSRTGKSTNNLYLVFQDKNKLK
jgi:hypothetical protein